MRSSALLQTDTGCCTTLILQNVIASVTALVTDGFRGSGLGYESSVPFESHMDSIGMPWVAVHELREFSDQEAMR